MLYKIFTLLTRSAKVKQHRECHMTIFPKNVTILPILAGEAFLIRINFQKLSYITEQAMFTCNFSRMYLLPTFTSSKFPNIRAGCLLCS